MLRDFFKVQCFSLWVTNTRDTIHIIGLNTCNAVLYASLLQPNQGSEMPGAPLRHPYSLLTLLLVCQRRTDTPKEEGSHCYYTLILALITPAMATWDENSQQILRNSHEGKAWGEKLKEEKKKIVSEQLTEYYQHIYVYCTRGQQAFSITLPNNNNNKALVTVQIEGISIQ